MFSLLILVSFFGTISSSCSFFIFILGDDISVFKVQGVLDMIIFLKLSIFTSDLAWLDLDAEKISEHRKVNTLNYPRSSIKVTVFIYNLGELTYNLRKASLHNFMTLDDWYQ